MNCFDDFVRNVVRSDLDGVNDRGNALRRVERANNGDDLQFQVDRVSIMILPAPVEYRLHGFLRTIHQGAQKPMVYAKSAGSSLLQDLGGRCFWEFVGIEKHKRNVVRT